MSNKVKTVSGRRSLRFSALEDIARDARALVESGQTRVLGNWSLERIFSHLNFVISGSMDGTYPEAPWIVRWIGPFFKKRYLKNPMKPGFNLPRNFVPMFYPDQGSAREALVLLEETIRRTQTIPMAAKHSIFGPMNHEEWTQLHLRHAELHLSFAIPGG